ncbi:MAG: translation initiation factor [Microbacteriaceae bacterium]|nr:translation initiation factor [Microbacteriaceae bacterium]
MRIEDAIRLAQEADLDLVEVAPNSKPPVAKIMDFGKFKYETAQKAKEAKRNQSNTILKEVRFRLKIDVHDYETKRKRAEGFLQAGDKVKAMILFRGREQSRPEQGVRLLQRFAEDVAEFGTVESTPTIDGRNMVMVIGPLKTKAEVKAEHDAKKPAPRERTERPVEFDPTLGPETIVEPAAAPATVVAPAAAVATATEAVATPVAAELQAPKATPPVEAPAAAVPVEAPKSAEPTKVAASKAGPAPRATPAAAPKPAAAPTPGTAPKPAAARPAVPKAPAATPKPATPASAAKPKAAPKTAPADVTAD